MTVSVRQLAGRGHQPARRQPLRLDRQLGRQPDDGASGGLHYELLAGSYTFQATNKGGSQQQPLTVAPDSAALDLRTAPVTALVVDAAGAPVAGASINHYGSTGSWVGSRRPTAAGRS